MPQPSGVEIFVTKGIAMKKVIGTFIFLLASAGVSVAAVNVEVNTPNASVRVGTPPPAPRVTVIEQHNYDVKKDNGKHKGHKKHKKHKKERHDDNGRHER